MVHQSRVDCADIPEAQAEETSWGSVPHAFLTGLGPCDEGVPLGILLAKGKRLGDAFEIEECLHEGRHGGVFRARNLATRDVVAIKVIRVTRDKANKIFDLLVNEYHQCSKVENLKHVMRVQDPRPFNLGDLSLIVMPMDFADGGSLRDWIEKDPDEATRLRAGIAKFKQVCLGVQAIHAEGHVHLDLKPENLLELRGVMKVADFGIGRCAVGSLSRTPKVLTHGIIGTPEYMSPEQFEYVRLKDVGFASDIYSLGVILFELLDGRLPFEGPPERLSELHLHEEPPALPTNCSQWAPIVARCLRKGPAERYRNVGALLRDVERVERGKTAGADAACPACGHLNPTQGKQAWATTCGNCTKPLPSDFFRSCPHCGVAVRRDLEDACPCCGHDVASLYRLQELAHALADAKQSDPEKTLELLRQMLSEKLGSQKDLLDDLKTQREKAQRVKDLTQSADNHLAAGYVEQAIADWKQVCELFPRHRRALEQTELLTRLLAQEASAMQQSAAAMDHGNFTEADSWLSGTLKALPNRNAPAQLLAACRERATKYAAALRSAKAARKRKAMQEAAARVCEALLSAPLSEECRVLQQDVAGALAQGEELAAKAQAHMDAADFAEAEAAITAITDGQTDSPNEKRLKSRLERVRREYQQTMPQAVESAASRDLQSAGAKVQEALRFCPNSCAAQSLRDAIQADMRRVQELMLDTEAQCRGAHFSEADKALQDATALWPTAPNLESLRREVASKKKLYEDARSSARQAMENRDLAAACTALETALSACPESKKTDDLLKAVRQDQAETDRLVETAAAAMRRAEFGPARQNWQLAHALWPSSDKVATLGSGIERTEKSYVGHLGRAQRACRWWMLDRAAAACSQAMTLCPEAQGPLAIQRRIEHRRTRLSAVKRHRDDLIMVLMILTGGGVFFGFMFWQGQKYLNDGGSGRRDEKLISHRSQPSLTPMLIGSFSIPETATKPAETVQGFFASASANGSVVVLSEERARVLEQAIAGVATGMRRQIEDYWEKGPGGYRKIGKDEPRGDYIGGKRAACKAAAEHVMVSFRELAKTRNVPLWISSVDDQWVGVGWGYCLTLPMRPKWKKENLLHEDMLDFGAFQRTGKHGLTSDWDILGKSLRRFSGSISAFSGDIRMPEVDAEAAKPYLADADGIRLDLLVVPVVALEFHSDRDQVQEMPVVEHGFFLGRARLRRVGGRGSLFDLKWNHSDLEIGQRPLWLWAVDEMAGRTLVPPWPTNVTDP